MALPPTAYRLAPELRTRFRAVTRERLLQATLRVVGRPERGEPP
jgi:hypothetical protein